MCAHCLPDPLPICCPPAQASGQVCPWGPVETQLGGGSSVPSGTVILPTSQPQGATPWAIPVQLLWPLGFPLFPRVPQGYPRSILKPCSVRTSVTRQPTATPHCPLRPPDLMGGHLTHMRMPCDFSLYVCCCFLNLLSFPCQSKFLNTFGEAFLTWMWASGECSVQCVFEWVCVRVCACVYMRTWGRHGGLGELEGWVAAWGPCSLALPAPAEPERCSMS